MAAIYAAVENLRALGAVVLSPHDPRIVDEVDDFPFVASDQLRSKRLVEDRHLAAIGQSDLLWVVSPDGYTGASTSGEIFSAVVRNIPVFSDGPILDSTIREYVKPTKDMRSTIRQRFGGASRKTRERPNILLDPDAASEILHSRVESLRDVISGRRGDRNKDAERELTTTRQVIVGTLW